ncbi:MAG: hypothetical protein AUH29_06155 [Candidatus Rokubacteria bacterium 13_1_40CM_69_27]|nr:MAG: hypothetical protein AUH29_06155 [Candidatus Rokubacteria bacterium 13_1_40CM_69_27]
MRPPVVLVGALALACSACAAFPPSVPGGAYYPNPAAPPTRVLSHALYRATQAAGDDPTRCSFALIGTRRVIALSAPDAIFYFSDGLAGQPPAHVDALVALAVAHEVLGHDGQRRALSLGVTAGFAALGFVVPGLSFADLLVNPLIVRAFTREQEISADRKAVLILGAMGHERPRRTLASALRAAAAVNGPDKGGAFAKEPDLEARLGALEPLERFGVAVKSSAPLRR